MKHLPQRRQPEHYPYHCPLPTRFADMDLWQHLNNASLIALHGEAAQAWLCHTLGPQAWRPAEHDGPTLALRHNATDFIAESHYPAPLSAGVRLLGHDAQGLRLATALFQHGQCVGLHESHWAAWQHGQVVALPHAWRAALGDADTEPADAPAAPDTPGLDQMHWHTRLATRFGDTDARHMASDASLARFAEQLRVGFLSERLGEQRQQVPGHTPTGFMVGHVALRWLRRAGRPPAAWSAGGRVLRVGERSIGVQGALFDDAGQCHALAESVLVCIDRASRRSVALPPALREALGQVG